MSVPSTSVQPRRILAFGAATAAAAAAVLLGGASPAQAIANPTVVSVVTAAGAAGSASATASCPPGFTLVGGGGRIPGAAGLVTMTDVIPDVAGNLVTVNGNETGAGTGAVWAVEAIAICDPVIVGVVRVSAVSALDGVASKAVTAFCPANTSLTGLGYQLRGAGGDVFPDDIVPTLSSATVAAFDNGAGATWSVESFALCAPVPAGAVPSIETATTGLNANAAKTISTPSCATPDRTVGTGARMTGATGNAILTQMAPNPVATRGVASADAFGGFAGPGRLESCAICW
jgi:hypothetical protein